MAALKSSGHETLAIKIESTDVSADPEVKPRGMQSHVSSTICQKQILVTTAKETNQDLEMGTN